MRKTILLFVLSILTALPAFSQFQIEYPNGQMEIEGRIRVAYNKRYNFDGNTDYKKDRFYMDQVRLKVKGTMYKYFNYEMTLEARSYDAGSIAKDLWLSYKPVEEFEIQAGQFKTPFSKQQIMSEEKLDLNNQCALTGDFPAGRDVGAMVTLQTKSKKYKLYLGAFTGNGYNIKNDDSKGKPLYVGRAEISPLGELKNNEGDLDLTPNPLFMIGANFAHSDDNVNTADYPRTIIGKKFMYGGDFTFKYKGLYLNGEFSHAQLMPDASPNYKAGGYLLHASYFIPSLKLQPVIEYNDYNPSSLTADDNQRTIVFGLNFLPKSNHNIKVMLDYYYHLKSLDTNINPWAENELKLLVQLLIK